MKPIFLALAAVAMLSACSTSPVAPTKTAATVQATPPDNLTGSAQYQSPDLPRRLQPIGGF